MIKKKGTYGELYVAAELTKAGFLVSMPFEQHSPYDLIVDKGGCLYKCQIKTTTSNRQSVAATFVSHVKPKYHREKNVTRRYSTKDITHFLILDTATDNLLVVPHPGKMYKVVFQYDELPLTKYITLNKTWARVFNRNWEFFLHTFQETLAINHQYCLDTYHEAILSNQENLPEEWGSYFKAMDFARALNVSEGYSKKFVEKTLRLCYSKKYKGYSTNLLIKRSLDYVEAE